MTDEKTVHVKESQALPGLLWVIMGAIIVGTFWFFSDKENKTKQPASQPVAVAPATCPECPTCPPCPQEVTDVYTGEEDRSSQSVKPTVAAEQKAPVPAKQAKRARRARGTGNRDFCYISGQLVVSENGKPAGITDADCYMTQAHALSINKDGSRDEEMFQHLALKAMEIYGGTK